MQAASGGIWAKILFIKVTSCPVSLLPLPSCVCNNVIYSVYTPFVFRQHALTVIKQFRSSYMQPCCCLSSFSFPFPSPFRFLGVQQIHTVNGIMRV